MPATPDREAISTLGRIAFGGIISAALGVAARLGIADRLADGPKTAEELAAECGAHAPSLRRLLRALAAAEVFEETPDGRYALTPVSELLRRDVPGSMRSLVAMIAGGVHARAWAEAMHSFRTGQTAVEHVYGTGTFEALGQNPEEARIFNDAMTENTAMLAHEVVAAYDFSRYPAIVDVGGGHGLLLSEVLKAAPQSRGILYDLPHVVAAAGPILERAGVAGRCEAIAGSFFEEVPAGGDLYMMKAIIHDWDDDRSETILRNCRDRLGPQGRVAVIDRVMPERILPGGEARRVTLMDINMLVMVGGRERTEQEFATLLKSAGLSLESVTPTPSGVCVLEASPA